MNPRVVSARFPYLPLHIELPNHALDVEALLDTGFDGDIVLSPATVLNGEPPDHFETWTLADGTDILAPAFFASAQLPGFASLPVVVTALGDEPIVGRGVTDRFRVTLDHGR